MEQVELAILLSTIRRIIEDIEADAKEICDFIGHNYTLVEQKWNYPNGTKTAYMKFCTRCGIEKAVENKAKD